MAAPSFGFAVRGSRMIPLQPPRYEVINSRPSLRESIREFTLGEWATWAGVTTGSAIYGYAVGEKKAPSWIPLPADVDAE